MIHLDPLGSFSKFSGAVSGSVSKWEKSFFGGFYRLVVDYPSVKIDDSVEFNTAASPLSFFEKEKILKIFISQSKIHDLISELMQNAKTKKEVNYFGETTIKTIIDNRSKKRVLDCLISDAPEYGPLFNHYKKFIMDSEIFFHQIKNEGNGKNKQQQKEQEEKESKSKSKNETKGKDKKKSKKLTSKEIEANESKFEDALKKTIEHKIKYKSLSGFDKSTTIEIQESSFRTKFSKKEKDIGDRLTNMLDISFDPTEDIVKNLRLGKLDISKIAEVPAGNIAIYKQSVENQTTKPFSVAILCDESGSMAGGGRIDSQYSIVKSLYHCFSDILPQEKIFIYGHTSLRDDYDRDVPGLFVYQDKYNNNFVTSIDNMLDRNCNNNYDGPIIEEVYKQIRSFTNDRIIFIVLSDGQPSGHNYGGPNDFLKMKQIIEKCKRDDFVTVGIGIETFHVKDLYQYSAIVKDLDEMPKKVSHIVNHVVKTEFQ